MDERIQRALTSDRTIDITTTGRGSVQADLSARARPITEEAERREVIAGILEDLGRGYRGVDEWVARSPLVEVEVIDPSG